MSKKNQDRLKLLEHELMNLGKLFNKSFRKNSVRSSAILNVKIEDPETGLIIDFSGLPPSGEYQTLGGLFQQKLALVKHEIGNLRDPKLIKGYDEQE